MPVVGFCDGFGAWTADSVMTTFLPSGTAPGALDALWVTCAYVQRGVGVALAARGAPADGLPVRVVGSPTLEHWRLAAEVRVRGAGSWRGGGGCAGNRPCGGCGTAQRVCGAPARVARCVCVCVCGWVGAWVAPEG